MLTAPARPMQITLVDSGGVLLESLQQKLEQDGHCCFRYRTTPELMAALGRETFDLLVIDWTTTQTPDIDISEWISSTLLSPRTPFFPGGPGDGDLRTDPETSTPVPFLTTLHPPPYTMKVDALLCRRGADTAIATRSLRFGPYRFEAHADAVMLKDERMTLTSKEYSLALLLFSNCGRPLSRDYMMAAVWKSTAQLSTRTLDVHISRLRAKLMLAEHGFHLRTLFGHGYRLEHRAALF